LVFADHHHHYRSQLWSQKFSLLETKINSTRKEEQKKNKGFADSFLRYATARNPKMNRANIFHACIVEKRF